jgi:ABC-type sugar transport system ATPase subunit
MNVVRSLHGHAVAGVRPEHVELAHGASHGPDCRSGRVERAVFLGSLTRVVVTVEGEPLTLELMGRREDLVPGLDVTIRIPAHTLLRLDDGA